MELTRHMFNQILILLLSAVFVSVVFHRLHLPAIVGYITVGIVTGPHLLAWVPDTELTHDVAEFGVVFLLFMIGLEFSLSRLISMRRVVFGFGGLQVLLSMLITILVGAWFGMTLAELIVVGSIVALSSTAIVSKQLTEQFEINAHHGQNAIGILLFQDLAVIPILILIPSLVNIDLASLTISISWAVVKGSIAIATILLLGRWLLRPLFYFIAKTRSLELFTLTALLITLGCAWLTDYFGLSLALGAFLAGIMLGETEFRHQLEVDLRPFRDILLGLFFISVGMQLNLSILMYAWPWMLMLLVALLVFKTVLIGGLGLIFTRDPVVSARTALVLGQGGEFGFVILSLALSYQLLPTDYGQVILAAILMSMLIAPFIIEHNKRIVSFLLGLKQSKVESSELPNIHDAAHDLSDHVIICGFGRVGQNIARLLEHVSIAFIALDLDPERIKHASLAGDNVVYADATHYQILKAARIDQAKALVVSFAGQQTSLKILQQVRVHHKKLPIIVRSYDESDTDLFYDNGATEVIPESLEASLMLASHILLLLKIPPKTVNQLIKRSRDQRYDLMRMVFPGEEEFSFEELPSSEILQAVEVPVESKMIGAAIGELIDENARLRIAALRRGKQRLIDPDLSTRIQAHDILCLYGSADEIDRVESLL